MATGTPLTSLTLGAAQKGTKCSDIELIPSWLCLAKLQYVDGLGKFPGTPGAAAQLTENPPRLELRVRPFAGHAEFRVGAVGLFLRLRLVLDRMVSEFGGAGHTFRGQGGKR